MSKEKTTKKEKEQEQPNIPHINDVEWTDYVLGLLSEDEKISGNPTTDGLRRVFETALNCILIRSQSKVVQSPDPNNEKRATVVHSLVYVLKNMDDVPSELKTIAVDGSADVYWGNCDKVYRNHPVAVAETRAEGRALRRALRLRKVVAAEEIAKDIEDHPDENSVNKISHNQINFIDVMAKRLNINVVSLMNTLAIPSDHIDNILHDQAVMIIKELSKHQQNLANISSDLLGYQPNWKTE
jgi:hypothetical protein